MTSQVTPRTIARLQTPSSLHPKDGTSEVTNTKKPNDYPFFAPRFWHGWGATQWWSLLAENEFRFDKFFDFATISAVSAVNTIGSCIQSLLVDRKAERLPLVAPPIFVLGHWRTGTTFLHKLLSLDKRHWAPTCMQCMAPSHFVVSGALASKVLYLPRHRPQDNVDLAWDEPQECEYALAAMGLPSVYRNYAFPSNKLAHLESIDMEGVDAEQVARWKAGYMKFVKVINYVSRRPLVLKSPANTGRIRLLLEMFPDAKFIHIARSPHAFIPSTIRMHELLSSIHGLQSDLRQFDAVKYAFDCFSRMYRGFERDRPHIPTSNYHELSFEQLVSNPVEALQAAYRSLEIDGFETVRPAIVDAITAKKDYVRNRHEISPNLRERIDQSCRSYNDQFGYRLASELEAA